VRIASKIILLLQKGELFESFKLRYPVHKTVHLISSWENICTVLFNRLLQAKAQPKGGPGSENTKSGVHPVGCIIAALFFAVPIAGKDHQNRCRSRPFSLEFE
jgi:hypothetical protein